MKTVILYSSIILGALTLGQSKAKAQVHVDINIGRPVYVAPAPVEVSYYYLPDVEAYYCVPQKVFFYQSGSRWVSGPCLPGYRSYDVYHVRHIVVNEPRPYLRHDYYRSRYNVRTAYVQRDYRGPDYGHRDYRDRREYNDYHDHGNRGHDNRSHTHGNGRHH